MTDIIKRMCIRQNGCWCCAIGKAAHSKALDCGQYVDRYPQLAEWIASAWLKNNVEEAREWESCIWQWRG